MPDRPFTLTPRPPVMVPFQGERAGAGPMTVGQHNILQWLQSAPEPFDSTIGGPLDLPAQTRLCDLLECLAHLIARHEGLRTTFDTDPPGRQLVRAAGELPVAVYTVDPARPDPAGPDLGGRDPAGPAAVAEALGQTWQPGRACGPDQLPLWVAVAVRADEVYAAWVRYSHLVVDFAAMEILRQELAARLRTPAGARGAGPDRDRSPEPREPPAPGRLPVPHQPLDEAALEQTPKQRRRLAQAQRHWEHLLPRLSPCLYPAPSDPRVSAPGESTGEHPDPPSGGSAAVEIWSPAAALALHRVAARTGRSRPSAVLAAICALLARRTGCREVVFPTLAGNRFERRLAGYVGTLAQATIAAVEVAGAGFDELVRRAARGVLRASRYGRYDIYPRVALTGRVERERGVRLSFEPLFNSPAVDGAAADLSRSVGALPAADSVRAALPGTRWRHSPMRRMSSPLRFDLFDYDETMHLSLWTGDTARLDPATAEELLRAVERLLTAAAETDLSPAEMAAVLAVPPIAYGPGWCQVDGCQVELAAVRRVLDAALAPALARVFPEVAGRPLVAYLVTSEAAGTPAEAHERCLAALPGEPTAMTPGYYVVCAQPPVDPDDPASWHGALAEGTGRDHPAGG